MTWKASGYFPDGLESFWIAWKISRESGNIPDCLEIANNLRTLFYRKNFLGFLEFAIRKFRLLGL